MIGEFEVLGAVALDLLDGHGLQVAPDFQCFLRFVALDVGLGLEELHDRPLLGRVLQLVEALQSTINLPVPDLQLKQRGQVHIHVLGYELAVAAEVVDDLSENVWVTVYEYLLASVPPIRSNGYL